MEESFGRVAQWLEQRSFKPLVGGSNPSTLIVWCIAQWLERRFSKTLGRRFNPFCTSWEYLSLNRLKQFMKRRQRDFYYYLNSGFEKAHQGNYSLSIPHGSKGQLALLEILQKEGFIQFWEIDKEKEKEKGENSFPNFPALRVHFKKTPPGRKFQISPFSKTKIDLHLSVKEIRAYTNFRRLDLLILSTNRGLMSHRDCLQYSLGGLLLCRLQLR